MQRACIISDDFFYLVGVEEMTSNGVDTIFFFDINRCMKELSSRTYSLYIIHYILTLVDCEPSARQKNG